METISNYTAHIDAKKRITLRGARYDYYEVREYANGCYILEPSQLVRPESISAATLRTLDESVSNLKAGRVSDPIDLSDFKD